MISIKQNKPISYVQSVLKRFEEKAAGSNLAELQHWFSDECYITKYHTSIKKEQKVFTLLSTGYAKSIHSFFYPTKVLDVNNNEVSLQKIVQLNGNNGVLINGRLGQGKSMLLKYLQFLELNTGDTIPIFLELRKIRTAGQILEQARDKINSYGLSCSNKLFEFLLNEGRISLFLDGFDEVNLDNAAEYNQELTEIITKYGKAKIIVTSRFNTEVSNNPKFKKFSISLLERSEHIPFLKKTISKTEEVNPIILKIGQSSDSDFDFSVLDTPLMLTWFIITYKKRFKIPKTKLGFYEDLFVAILSMHDGLKESYNRTSRSKLNDDELKLVFSALCYFARKDQKNQFTQSEIEKTIRRSLNYYEYENVKSKDYLYDLTNVTCLLKKDGHEYEFIHETVAQYFSAYFIKNASEENAEEFYNSRLKDFKIFEDELMFLEGMDELRITKYFMLPSCKQLESKSGNAIKRTVVEDLINSSFLLFEYNNEKLVFITSFSNKSREYIYRNSLKITSKNNPVESNLDFIIKNNIRSDFDKFKDISDRLINSNPINNGVKYKVVTMKDYLIESGLYDRMVIYISLELYKILADSKLRFEGLISKQVKKKSVFS